MIDSPKRASELVVPYLKGALAIKARALVLKVARRNFCAQPPSLQIMKIAL